MGTSNDYPELSLLISDRDIRCFSSRQEKQAALGRSTPAGTYGTRSRGSGMLCLYEHTETGGRELEFNERLWRNLSDYDFDNITSSCLNRGQRGILADQRADGGPNDICPADAYRPNLGSFNDLASSAIIG